MFSFKIKALQVLKFTFNSQVLEKVFPQIVQTQDDECVLKIMSYHFENQEKDIRICCRKSL